MAADSEAMKRVCPILSIGSMVAAVMANKAPQPTLCVGRQCEWFVVKTQYGPPQRGEGGTYEPPAAATIAGCTLKLGPA